MSERPRLSLGVDTPLFYLDARHRWRLASDGLQWIIQKRTGVRRNGQHASEQIWRSVRFPTTPEVLRRDMRELDIKSTAEALRRIAEFPPHVARWEWDGRPFKGVSGAIRPEMCRDTPETVNDDTRHLVAAA